MSTENGANPNDDVLPLHFPEYENPDEAVKRPGCGKKNSLHHANVMGLPLSRNFLAGNGEPKLEGVFESQDSEGRPMIREGQQLQWEFNNMLGKTLLGGWPLGWVLMRLDPDRPSLATLGRVTIDGREMLSVVKNTLHFVGYLPRLGLSFKVKDPLEMELAEVVSASHLVYRGVRPTTVLSVLGIPLYRMTNQEIHVTTSRGLGVQLLESAVDLSFRVVMTEESPQKVDGPMVWLVHSPDVPTGVIPFGELPLQGNSSESINVSFERFPELRGRDLRVEVVSLRDERHLYTSLTVPNA